MDLHQSAGGSMRVDNGALLPYVSSELAEGCKTVSVLEGLKIWSVVSYAALLPFSLLLESHSFIFKYQ